jgi:hypothetical protein
MDKEKNKNEKIEEFEKFTKTNIEEVIRLATKYKMSKIKIYKNGYGLLIKPDCQGEPCCGGTNHYEKGIDGSFHYCIGNINEEGWVEDLLNAFHNWLKEVKREKSLIKSEIIFLSNILELFDSVVYYHKELDDIKDTLYDIYNEDLDEIVEGGDKNE